MEEMQSVGITAGASAPEVLIEDVISAFKLRFNVKLQIIETTKEAVSFKAPRILRASI